MREPTNGSVVLTGPEHIRLAWQRSYSSGYEGWVSAFGDTRPWPWSLVEQLENPQVIYNPEILCSRCRETA
jgi:hypothetical protein